MQGVLSKLDLEYRYTVKIEATGVLPKGNGLVNDTFLMVLVKKVEKKVQKWILVILQSFKNTYPPCYRPKNLQ